MPFGTAIPSACGVPELKSCPQVGDFWGRAPSLLAPTRASHAAGSSRAEREDRG